MSSTIIDNRENNYSIVIFRFAPARGFFLQVLIIRDTLAVTGP